MRPGIAPATSAAERRSNYTTATGGNGDAGYAPYVACSVYLVGVITYTVCLLCLVHYGFIVLSSKRCLWRYPAVASAAAVTAIMEATAALIFH